MLTAGAFWIIDPDGNAMRYLGTRVSWAEWMSENWPIVRVGNTRLRHARHQLRVSTLFLGTSPEFETMIFAEAAPFNLQSFRTHTRALAWRKHCAVIEVVREWGKANP